MLMYSNVRDFIQNVAIMKGSHAIKFGAELRLVQFPFVQFSDPHGDMNISNNATAYPGAGALSGSSGDGMASFLLGIVDSGSISTTNFISSQKQTWGFYAQDDWKVTPKLTLNLGMRYELFSPTYERFGRSSNFVWQNVTLYIPQGNNQDQALPPNFASSFPNVTVSRGQVNKYMYPWDKWDFGPRFGLAYKVAPKTVIRAGFGIFYGGEENLGGSPNLGENAPFNYTMHLGRTDLNDNALPNNFVTNPWFAGGFSAGWPSNVFARPPRWISMARYGRPARWCRSGTWRCSARLAGRRRWSWPTSAITRATNTKPTKAVGIPAPTSGPPTPASLARRSANSIHRSGQRHQQQRIRQLQRVYREDREAAEQRLTVHRLLRLGARHDGCVPASQQHVPVPRSAGFSSMYSNAQWDHRHSFTTGFVYELPIGKGKALGGL